MANNLNSSFNSEFRFNCGFHDAAADFAANRPNKWASTPHFSNSYRQGYLAGWAEASAGRSTEDSQEQWELAQFYETV